MALLKRRKTISTVKAARVVTGRVLTAAALTFLTVDKNASSFLASPPLISVCGKCCICVALIEFLDPNFEYANIQRFQNLWPKRAADNKHDVFRQLDTNAAKASA